ncbi:MAG TPA: response regulator transcription factor [Arachnia sp.]|nr:response regulator transcription factor [Arachnia sp.]HMT86257.1 response regulator transcription factor [Arachnia sp.]
MGALLVIDDDPHIRELVETLLRREGYETVAARDGQEALRLLGETAIDLCVVDAMMPRVDGVTFARSARRYYPELPLLMLTAKGQLRDKAQAFDAGADDYLVKPFEGAELVMRVKALLRRYRKVVEQTARAGVVVLDAANHVAGRDGERLELPLKEFELLFLLASHKGRTLTRRLIIDEVWGFDFDGNERTLDVHINRLRDRFGGESGFRIATVRGVGYRLEDA